MDDIPVPERLLEVFHTRRPMPLKLELRPTKRCNLYCRHCWRRLPGTPEVNCDDELPPERYVDLIREAVGLGVRKVELVGGGEPMFDSDAAMAYFREIKRQGVYGDLVTNGTRFTDEMIREMVEFGWDRIMFSIDGADARTHDYIRAQQGVFKRALTAMKRFAHWKLKLGVDRPLLGMVPVLTNRNHTQFSDFIRLAHKVGAYHVGFKPLVVQTKDAELLRIPDSQLWEMNRCITAAIPLAEKYGIDTNLTSIMHKPSNEVVKKSVDVTELYTEDVETTRNKLATRLALTQGALTAGGPGAIYERFLRFVQIPCYLPWVHLTITPEGDVQPCSGAGSLKTKLNVKDASLKEILLGEVFADFRENLAQGEFPAVCKGCCVGLFLDNRRHRQVLVETGAKMLEDEARQIRARRPVRKRSVVR